MKTSCFALVLLLTSLAVAQNQSPKEDPGLHYVGMALNVANSSQQKSLDGLVAVFIDDKAWASLSKDSDLGPFLKLKDQKADRRMVLFLAIGDDQSPRVAVYFDGVAATDVAVYTPGPGAKISVDLLKPVSKEAAKANDTATGWKIAALEGVASDDGEAIPAYRVSKAEAGK